VRSGALEQGARPRTLAGEARELLVEELAQAEAVGDRHGGGYFDFTCVQASS
jgi:hypothetical protein